MEYKEACMEHQNGFMEYQEAVMEHQEKFLERILEYHDFGMYFGWQLFPKWNQKLIDASSFLARFLQPFMRVDLIMHLGRPLAAFSLLAYCWLPLAAFWLHLVLFWVLSGSFLVLFCFRFQYLNSLCSLLSPFHPF